MVVATCTRVDTEVIDAAPDLGVLFDRILDAIVVGELTTGRIVQWNRAAEKLFGYTAAEAIGQPIEILMPGPVAQVHRAGLARYLRTDRGLIVDADGPVEMPARTRSGKDIRVELTLSELRDSSGGRFAVAAMRDATLRQQYGLTTLDLAHARAARTEAEAKLAGRDEMLAALANVLEGEAAPEELPLLARQLTEFRQLHAGQLQMLDVETDLVDIVHAATDDARRRTPDRRWLVHTPPVAAVSCDPARVRQVLDQLLDETTRRTRDGARVELRLQLISPHLAQLIVRSEACGDARPAGPGLQLSRALVQHQGGAFTTAISCGGSLEVVMTLPGSPHLPRYRSNRPRRPGRAAPS